MRSVLTARIRAISSRRSHSRGYASASSRSRLDLGSIFGARQASRTPPVERHGTPRNRPTRTGRQQQGRAPNQDKRRLGARQQRQPSRGRGTRGPRSIGLLMNNELCAGGWGPGAADAGLPMRLGHWMYMWRWPWHAARGWTGCMALSERWSWPWAWALI